MKENTRQHERYDIRVSAEVTVGGGQPQTCITRDLSRGGLGIESEWPLPDNVPVALELFVVVDDIEDESTTPLRLDGRVAWCRLRGERDYLAGVQFVNLAPEQLTYLQQLLAATSAT